MTRLLLAALCPLLLGCTAALGTALPTRPLLRAWMEAGYPIGQCADTEFRVRVLYDMQQLRRECLYRVRPPYPKTIWACTSRALSGFANGSSYILIRAIGNLPNHPLEKLIVHEKVHGLLLCSDERSDGDPKHRDKRIWGYVDEAHGVRVDGFENRLHEAQR